MVARNKYHVILLYYHVTRREDALGDTRIEEEKGWNREGEEVKDEDFFLISQELRLDICHGQRTMVTICASEIDIDLDAAFLS